MKRELLLSAAVMMLASGALAAPLSPEEALSRLQQSPQSVRVATTRGLGDIKLKYTLNGKDGNAALYVFDKADNGFMVVSADDTTLPLLGYSDNGSFDTNNLPPALIGWLEGYQEQIEYARANPLAYPAVAATRAIELPDWAPISPLLKTTWDQNAPFHDLCPNVDGKYCPTGCVATAMAQVMNYFKYPAQGRNSITYEVNFGSSMLPNYATLSMDFSEAVFDWGNMLNNYPANGNYTEAQAEAVAVLMVAAGYAVQMNYGTYQSGAISGYIPGAFIEYFNYDPSAMYVSRSQKTYSEWAQIIYNNLKNVGPVIYDGDTSHSGGHSFVCDGYQDDGYFHFNWGWSGVSDGYYLLDALNPPALGTGGAAGGFNFRQDVVLNVQPPKAGTTPAPEQVVLSGSLYGYSSSAYMYMGIGSNEYPGLRYYGNSDILFRVGAQIVEADNPNATPTYVKVQNNIFDPYLLDPGYVCYCNGTGNYPFPMISWKNLELKENVKYKVTIAYQQLEGTLSGNKWNITKEYDWQPATASVGYYNYFYVTKNGDDYDFDNSDTMELTCTELSPKTTVYKDVAAIFNLTLTNNNDTELSRGVELYLLNEEGQLMFYGDSFQQTLAPGETMTMEWTTPIIYNSKLQYNTAQSFYPALYDMDSNTVYYKSDTPVTVNLYPGTPEYNCSVVIDNEPIDKGIYQVANAQDFQVTTTVEVTSGIFSEDVTLYVLKPQGSQYHFEVTYPLELSLINAGESKQFVTQVSYPGAEIGEVYYMGILVGDANQLACQPAAFTALSNESGIEEIVSEPFDGVYRVYNLQGVKLLETKDASALSSLPRGLYIINGKKILK